MSGFSVSSRKYLQKTIVIKSENQLAEIINIEDILDLEVVLIAFLCVYLPIRHKKSDPIESLFQPNGFDEVPLIDII